MRLQTVTSVSQSVQAPPAGRYLIEPAASGIDVTAKHLFGLATVHARVAVVSGELVVADDAAESRLTVTASSASFDSGDARRDRAVVAPKFLDVEQHPTLSFTSGAVTQRDGRWVVAGVLTAHGEDAPLELTVTAADGDATGVTIRAAGQVDRFAHGITAARGLAGRTIRLQITAHAVPETPTT